MKAPSEHLSLCAFALLVCALLGAMLLVIAVSKPLRRSLHRKFFL